MLGKKKPSCCQSVKRDENTWIIRFTHPMSVVSNSVLNGGVQQEIEAIFNRTVAKVDASQSFPGGSMEGYLKHVAQNVGLDPQRSAGLITAASIENTAMEYLHFRQLEVWAVATAGVDVNGARAGEPASYYEEKGEFYPEPGTINIMLIINANLSPATLVKCVITATEAKTAALQELMAGSSFSTGLATGSGTDGIIVVANPLADFTLTDAGTHSKLGECIGVAVKKAVQEALYLETGLSSTRQMNVLERLKRFQVDEAFCWQKAEALAGPFAFEDYQKVLGALIHTPALVSLAVALIHLEDEVAWGLLPVEQAGEMAWDMLEAVLRKEIHGEMLHLSKEFWGQEAIIQLLIQGINALVLDKLKSEN